MEAEFSDSEFSEILGAFAEVDDLLIGWDVLMTPLLDSEATELDGLSDQPKSYPQQYYITQPVVNHEADALATRSFASNAPPPDIVPSLSLSNLPASSHGVGLRAGVHDVPTLQLNYQRQQLRHLQGAQSESYPHFEEPTPASAQHAPLQELRTYAKAQEPPQGAGLHASGLHPALSPPPLLPQQQQQVWLQALGHQPEPQPHTLRAATVATLPYTVQTPSTDYDSPRQTRPFSPDGASLAISSNGAGDKYSVSYNSTGAGAVIREYDSGSARLPPDLFAPPQPVPAGPLPTAAAAAMAPAAEPAVRHSGGAVVHSGGAVVHSGGAVVHSGGAVVNSGGAVVNSGGAVVNSGGAVVTMGSTIVLPSPANPPTQPVTTWTRTTSMTRAAASEGTVHRANGQQGQVLPQTGSVPGPHTSVLGLRHPPHTEAAAGGRVSGFSRAPDWVAGPAAGCQDIGCQGIGPGLGPVGAVGTAPLQPGGNGAAATSPGPSLLGALLAGLPPMAAAPPGASAPTAVPPGSSAPEPQAGPGTAVHHQEQQQPPPPPPPALQQPQPLPPALQQPQPQVPRELLLPQLPQSQPTVGPGQPSELPSWQVAHGVGAAGTNATWTPTPAVATSATVRWPASDGEPVGLGSLGTSLAATGAATAAVTAAATAAGGNVVTTGGGGASGPGSGGPGLAPVSGASLLADLLAEATSGSWAALATGLAPLPAGTGRTAEELLAGLDLSEVFAPPKPSHAKRIRGHVRRAAELKAQLADRVRAIQRLAAENADLRSRARVLELVVRCRDEQLQLLRSYRTSPDGKTFYVEQGWAEVAGPGGGGPEAAEAGLGRRVPYSAVNLAALASMPASALLAVFRQLVSELSVSLAAVETQDSAIGSVATALAPPQDCHLGPQYNPAAAGVHGTPLVLPPAHLPASAAAATFVTAGTPAVGAGGPPGCAGVFDPCQHGAGAVAGSPTGAVARGAELVPFGVAGDGHGGAAVAIVAAADGTTAGLVGGGAGAAATWVVPPPPPLAQLRAQIAKFRSMVRYLGLVNDEVCRFVDTTLDGDTAAPDPGHWLRLVQALRLSEQQLADAAALYSCWQGWLGRIREERRSIAAALDRLLSVNRYGNAYSESTGEYGTDRDAIHRIHANVMREKVLAVLIGEALCCHILTDIQWARAIVLSRPYVLDPRELLCAAAQLFHPYARRLLTPLPASGNLAGTIT